MRRRSGSTASACVLLVLLAACSDHSPTVLTAEPETVVQASLHGDCDLVATLDSDVTAFFRNPERQTARSKANALGDACLAGNQPTVTGLAVEILVMIETAVNAGRVLDVSAGSNLANSLLACATSLCKESALPDADFAKAFGHAGTFAIRSGNSMAPVVARNVVTFMDTEPEQENSALWGATVSQAWTTIMGTPAVVAIYGWQEGASEDPSGGDYNIGGLGYHFDRAPKNDANGAFAAGLVQVWVCFGSSAALPHDEGVEPVALLVKEGTGVPQAPAESCPLLQPLQSASVLAPVISLVRSVVPRDLFAFAMRTDKRTHLIGGDLDGWSHITAGSVNPNGYLEFDPAPQTGVKVGADLGVKVGAYSGGGTAMGGVDVTLRVLNNKGEPAGAVITGGTATTSQANGIADLSNAKIHKAGGYRICAQGEFEGLTFDEICSDLFQVRNK